MAKPIKVEVRLSKEQLITPGGLVMAGHLLNKTGIYEYADELKTKENAKPTIKNSDVIGAYVGLLCQGKTDYQAVNEFKEEAEYYSNILGIKKIPSEETLRQRLDAISPRLRLPIMKSNIELLQRTNASFTECLYAAENPANEKSKRKGYIPIDIDVVPFDNSNSKKEGVSFTYKKHMGYAPIMAYMGAEGYLINTELREGSQHCQNGTADFLSETVKTAKKLTGRPLLVRMDAGNDSVDNLVVCMAEGTKADFIIKRNLRKESLFEWVDRAAQDPGAAVTNPRWGKTVYTGSVYRTLDETGSAVRIVYEAIERTSHANGQLYIDPEYEVNTWWCSFPAEGEGSVTDEEVIQAYREHGTSEQFHSEIKTDMDMERLPSGYFKTNAAVLLLGMLAYNILRYIGQTSLKKDDAPLKRPVRRRRIRTVIQNLITIAVRVVHHARKVYLNLGRSNAWRFTFMRVFEATSS